MTTLRYSEKFRAYQRKAISMARRYARLFPPNAALDFGEFGAALVYHPTGTGKTAVIAGLAHASPEIGNVLILTTREAIRDQLASELSGNLFLEKQKFDLGSQIRLSKSTYVLGERRMLLGPTAEIHGETCKPFTSELRDFAEKQFSRLVDDPSVSFLDELTKKRSIVIMTVQMLVGLQRQDHATYAKLRDLVALVLFDEGHYEPAVKYSDAVRNLRKPVVLMSATPFRNDLKPFRVEAQNIDIYKFGEAVGEGVIRDVTVVQRPPTRDSDTFCRDVISYCENEFGVDRAAWPRIIVHCDDAGAIERLGDGFIANGFKNQVVAIHDQFHKTRAGYQTWQHQAVPPPRQTDALIWIHQYKLMEGIDDHRFRVLAFFDPLKNVRSVVQQIGRVIRRAPGEAGQNAIVLDHYRGRVRQYWELYKAYDNSISAEYLTKTLSRYYLDKFIEVQPEIDYIQRKFRGRLDLRTLRSVEDEILFDRKVTLKRVGPNEKIASFAPLVETSLAVEDYEFTKSTFGDNAIIFMMAKVDSPEFLNTMYFAEPRHGVLLLLLLPKHGLLAIATTGSAPDGLSHLESASPEQLDRLLIPGQSGRISSVTSRNTNLGNRVVRRRAISAPSIADVPPILDEYGHVVASVIGYNGTVPRVVDDLDYQESVDEEFNIVTAAPSPIGASSSASVDLLRRYVGLANGRVSEQGPPLRLKAFKTWIESLAEQMESGVRYRQVYDRFASVPHSRVNHGTARNLLLDLFDVADQYKHKDTAERLRGDDLCVDRKAVVLSSGKPLSKFDVELNGSKYEVDIIFNEASQRYRLESPDLDKAFVRTDGRTRSLGRVLNESQSFNVIPDDRSVIYVHGRFYAPGLKFGPRFSQSEFFAGHCLYPSETFKRIKSEKGARVVKSTDQFDPASLFGLIDGWRKGFDTKELKLAPGWTARYKPENVSFKPTLCICDDTQKESADFIFADSIDRRVVLVHAKASKKFREYSASAVQEICAQAQKNTSPFSTFSLQRMGNYDQWNRPHKFTGDGKVSLTIKNRIRKPTGYKAKDAWGELSDLLHNPLTAREIWLVLGNMLSAEHFDAALRTDDPAPEVLQLNHLLQTTIAAGASVGAKTRIFCAP
jgi:hypothetical protein